MVAVKQDRIIKIMKDLKVEKLNKNKDISSIENILEIFTKIHNENFENKIEKEYFLNIFSNIRYEVYVLKNDNMHDPHKEENECISGYIVFYDTIDTLELFEIAVDKRMQNRGLGNRLLSESIEFLFSEKKYSNRNEEDSKIILEVREDNCRAIRLYEKSGFEQISLRKNYYGQDKHGKIMMKKIRQ